MMLGVRNGRDESMLRLLLERKADVNAADTVPRFRIGGWGDGVGSVHDGVCGAQCAWCMVKLFGGESSDALDGVGDDVPGAWG